MGILNPIVSKFNVVPGTSQEIYACPAGKSHAIVDVSFLKNDTTTDAMVAVALTTQSNPDALGSLDYFIDDIFLSGSANTVELNKVIVGQGERLIVKVIEGSAVNVRISGVEENNPMIAKAGRLAAVAVPGTSQVQVYANALPDIAYVSASITVYNASATTAADIELWITSSASPSATDKVVLATLTAEDTMIMENVLISPNEKIFARSSQPNAEFFVNGMVVRA